MGLATPEHYNLVARNNQKGRISVGNGEKYLLPFITLTPQVLKNI
jgi:hypothetical protein